ncbi:hypothetical protein P7228_03105 [Altererythrobacter arenosus]|uniref:Uncharacterized protein n=1 Tax=Altererythrobacter arenosus TaxID=3032592 RepID=A0ABY8FST5_9SPHN|nr:hypothetical protein [Altererythrobacter sp. CAU 1644]WFL78073.1 hypothetical protein P7228_03105 [Altererythrobacter sp. CAU 1644]
MRRVLGALAAAALLVVPVGAAQAQLGGLERTEVKEGYQLKPGEVRILVFRPDVRVGAQTTGGMHEPNAEWTEQAKANLMAALEKEHQLRGTQLVMVGDQDGENTELVEDYTALFTTVANAVLNHKMVPSNRLPTKRDKFDWTLGDGAARLKPLGGDYGLFFYTYDSYGSTGRKVIQGLALLLGGGFVPSGVHIGYAGLVDLDTGDLVWLNVDTSMGGDPRTVDGAEKRVKQLMEDFPVKAEGVAAPEGTIFFEPALPPDPEMENSAEAAETPEESPEVDQ